MTKPSNVSYVWIATYPKGMQVVVRSRREVMPNAIDLGTWKLQTIDGPRFHPSAQLTKLLLITAIRLCPKRCSITGFQHACWHHVPPSLVISRFSPFRWAVSAVHANQDWLIVKAQSGTDTAPF
jgi:hypothetical protein